MTSILSSRDAQATPAVIAEWSRRRSQMDWCSTQPEPDSLYNYKELTKGVRGDGVRVKRVKVRRSKQQRGKPIVGRLRREHSGVEEDSEIETAEVEVYSSDDVDELTDEQLAVIGKDLLRKSLRKPADRGPRGRARREEEELPTLAEDDSPAVPEDEEEDLPVIFDVEAPASAVSEEKEEVQPPAWRGATGRGSTTKTMKMSKGTERYSSVDAARAADSKNKSSPYGGGESMFASAMNSARAAYYGDDTK